MNIPRLLMVAAVIGGAAPLAAQDVTGSLEGWVRDSAGVPLAGAEIVLRGTGLPDARTGISSARGYYRIDHVPIGIYQASIRMVGYRSATVAGLQVRLGRTTLVDEVRLVAALVQLEPIVVAAQRPVIDPASAAGGANLPAERFNALPVDRSYREIPALLPGANRESDGVNISGSGALDNLWFVDGANVTNPGNGSSSIIIPHNFVKEVEVRTGGYEAEYRAALGGIINVVTQSGGDTLHGEVFGYFLNNRITGSSRVIGGEEPPGNFRQYEFGASLGGPVIRRRLWFFGAYAPAVYREQVDVGAPLGTFVDRAVRHSFAGKLTWQPTPRTLLVASLSGDPTGRDEVGGGGNGIVSRDALLARVNTGGVAVSLHATHTLSPRLQLNASLTRMTHRFERLPISPAGAALVNFVDSNDIVSGGQTWLTVTRHRVEGARLAATYRAQDHQLKAGLELNRIRLSIDDTFEGIEQLSMAEDTVFRFAHADFRQLGTVRNRVYSAYLQDSWVVSSRLRINAGVRWDGERNYGSDGALSIAIMDEFQPRVGFVFRPSAGGVDRVFGSYGRFYEQLFTSLGSFYFVYGSRANVVFYTTDPRTDTSGGSCATSSWFCVTTSRVPDPGLEGQSFDEVSLGYERLLGGRLTARARAVHRRLRWAIDDSVDPVTFAGTFGNPGRGALSAIPRARHHYTALELSVHGELTPRLWMLASWVYARNTGNYVGLNEGGYENVNWGGAFDNAAIMVNAVGPLRNDRPHVVKTNVTWRLRDNLVVGSSLVYQSGAPLSELADSLGWQIYLVPRGTAGRVPGTWDLGLRLQWSPVAMGRLAPSMLFDVYHIGSPRRPLTYNELRWFDVDGQRNGLSPNPEYRSPTSFQPPMTARLGVVVSW